jgi:hypothetical protein
VPFEALMDCWSQPTGHADQIALTQTLLAYAMTVGCQCAFVEAADRLDSLMAMVKPTTVVTLNYDVLTEEALLRVGLRFTYPSLPGPDGSDQIFGHGIGEPVQIFKLHGSVNWIPLQVIPHGADARAVWTAAAKPPAIVRHVQSGSLTARQTWRTYVPPNRASALCEWESGRYGSPVAAVYGTGKNVLSNPDHVDQHRSACIKHLAAAPIDCAVAVGIRPVCPEDDPVLDKVVEVLASSAAHKLYVSPDEGACAAFQWRGFNSLRATLEQLVG